MHGIAIILMCSILLIDCQTWLDVNTPERTPIVNEGDTGTLECVVNTSGSGLISVNWNKDLGGSEKNLYSIVKLGNAVAGSARIEYVGKVNHSDTSLIFFNATSEDSGTYICDVTVSGIGNKRSSIYFPVKEIFPALMNISVPEGRYQQGQVISIQVQSGFCRPYTNHSCEIQRTNGQREALVVQNLSHFDQSGQNADNTLDPLFGNTVSFLQYTVTKNDYQAIITCRTQGDCLGESMVRLNVSSASCNWSVSAPSTVVGVLGGSVVLPCSFTINNGGDPVYTVTWTTSSNTLVQTYFSGVFQPPSTNTWGDRASLIDQASLRLNSITQQDSGQYTCKIGLDITIGCSIDANGRDEQTLARLVVIVKPSNMTVSGLSGLVPEGRPTTVQCTIGRILLPTPYDIYFKQGDGAEYKVTGVSTSSNSDGTTFIAASATVQLDKSDNGKTFQCIVRDRGDGTALGSTNVTVQIAYLPTSALLSLVDKSTSDPIQAGAQVVFQCTTPDGNPAPILQIYRGSTAASNTGSSPLKYPRIILGSDNLATFRCKATTMGLSGEITSNVLNLTNIHYRPTVTVTLKGNPVTVAEGDDVTLQCDARGNPPVYTEYRWTHITFNSPESQLVSTGRELVLSRVTYLDNGEYVCGVRNSVGQGLGRKRLNVLYSPKIAVESRIVSASIGEPATLSISVTANPANVSFSWKKRVGDGREPVVAGVVLTDPSSLKSKLFIPSVQGSDYGQYVCTVSHTVGSREFTFEIRPKGPPERPTDFRISSWTSVSVTLTWMSGFSGGSNQSFHIQYKETSRTRWQKDDQLVFPDPGYMKTSKAKVTNLNPTTSYDFRLVAINNHPSTNSSGFTGAFTQKTKARPKVLDDKVSVSITPTVATVSWTISSGIEDITSYVVKYCEKGTVVCNRHKVSNSTATSAVITLDEGFQDYTFSLLIYEEDDLVQVVNQPTSEPSPVQLQVDVIVGVAAAVFVLLILAVITAFVMRHFRKSKSGRDVPSRETPATGVITEMKDLNSQPPVKPPATESSIYDVPDHQVNETPIYTDLQPHSAIR